MVFGTATPLRPKENPSESIKLSLEFLNLIGLVLVDLRRDKGGDDWIDRLSGRGGCKRINESDHTRWFWTIFDHMALLATSEALTLS